METWEGLEGEDMRLQGGKGRVKSCDYILVKNII